MASHSVSSSSSAPQFRLHLLRRRGARHVRARAAGGGDGVSYLDMWRKAVDRERRSEDLARRLGGAPLPPPEPDDVRAKTARFGEMLRVPREERDRAQRLQVIDRAAAAIAAARALLRETLPPPAPETATQEVGSPPPPGDPRPGFEKAVASGSAWAEVTNLNAGDSFPNKPEAFGLGTPGPDFWSWSPPVESSSKLRETDTGLKLSKKKSYAHRPDLFMEEEQPVDVLSLPFESSLFEKNEDRSHPHFEDQSLPPFQSFIELQTVASETLQAVDVEEKFEAQFSKNAAEAARALDTAEEESSHGVYPDGSMWWKETGVEERPDGVICKWTIIRGVSADGAVEWEDKYWEASDQFDYKELGSEKSGRDAAGNVWREYWKESMWQDFTCGIMHMEKTADKWGTNAKEDQWREQWWEHYDATGKAEKWADKWCSLDPNTPLDVGHAHVWHERWGEKYDGNGGSTKYTDKWAERSEEDGGWSKWGDKWDEHFGPDGHGVKQGETWWEGRHGDRWNRTWGEGHNCSGWVHKYGRSSGGEHWDTHVPQDTWYERHPHFGFEHCFNNSGRLRAVRRQPRP